MLSRAPERMRVHVHSGLATITENIVVLGVWNSLFLLRQRRAAHAAQARVPVAVSHPRLITCHERRRRSRRLTARSLRLYAVRVPARKKSGTRTARGNALFCCAYAQRPSAGGVGYRAGGDVFFANTCRRETTYVCAGLASSARSAFVSTTVTGDACRSLLTLRIALLPQS